MPENIIYHRYDVIHACENFYFNMVLFFVLSIFMHIVASLYKMLSCSLARSLILTLISDV